MKLVEIYKSLKDKPLNEQVDSPKTYGDLSPEEWDEIRPKTNNEYDPGNEPLEIQHSETGITYFIEPEDIEAYVNGEEVIAVDPDRGMDAIRVTKDETDVVGVSEDELEDFMVSGDRSANDVDDDDRFSGMDDMFGADLEENEKDLKSAIIDVLKKEGGAAGLEPILAIASKLGVTKSQIKKVLNSISKIKKHTNGDYILTPINEKAKSGKRPDYADVDGDGDEEESMEKAFKDKEKMDEAHCTEQEIAEGTCGYAQDGKVDVHNTHKMKPASSIKIISLQERFQKLANIKK